MNISWVFPYPSLRVPVFARNVVATSQPLAAQAGLQMLAKGGNAVDAAIATAITLCVVEPTGNGLGSDAFALVWDGKVLHGLNGSGRSPAAWSPSYFKDFKKMPQLGWDSVTIPGAVDAWRVLSQRFGRLPFTDLFEPALRYARDGFVVPPITSTRWSTASDACKRYTEFSKVFLPHGRPPAVGEIFRPQGLHETLLDIAETEGESFYRGRLAALIAEQSKRQGGGLTVGDLEEHRSDWVTPVTRDWHDVTLHELPPNGQGLLVLMALGILDHIGFDDCPPHSPESYHLQIESMKLAFATAQSWIADPEWMDGSPLSSLTNDIMLEAAQSIRMDCAYHPTDSMQSDGGTVYLSSADQNGMMVSFIQSNYKGFGSGVVIDGTGISLHNRGAGFTLQPGSPNQVAGRKRPFHTIIPAFVTTMGGLPLMSFGVMGAHMQAQGHLQLMIRIFGWGENPQAACDAPRWYLNEDYSLSLETGFPLNVRHHLEGLGHVMTTEKPRSVFGGAQLILALKDGYCAASDPRKDGQAVGF